MNETRKQIIGLLEFYMKKTLSEGCLVDIDGDNKNIQKVGELDGSNAIMNIYGSRWLLRPRKTSIIGHYDITAVLKYFADKGYDIMLDEDGAVIIVYQLIDEDFFIPNKPLHLYTEQEEKDLLELLTKLNKNYGQL